ncbi:hypothetical protein R70723_19100 [Paenibacillus sp. FSL R7-0273]|uniref:hypothetical protein n=1 Tax=Paenibacillus sp. FSL R7-0273 TaxID=1536772 RepID=UPI0004F7891D|nr:hypothetical protein [Paenibacillus sp. FSL R7-0273]AIQ47765.1 hypothetical protein R70723_19100 [Paenibacillus sp. FSL R7-0273]OMF94680.1 hypothetical protein BK144_09165 [Paenibacillus sp. FSL R7-0273]
MRKTDWIKVLLAVSLIGNATLFINHKRDSQRQELRYELLNAYIYRDLTQLEMTIQHQIDNNWVSEPLVPQKLDDAIDSVILHMGMEQDDDKEATLWTLHDYLKGFSVNDDTYSVSLTDKQRADYIRLGEELRSSGWNYGVGSDTKWDAFEARVEELVLDTKKFKNEAF